MTQRDELQMTCCWYRRQMSGRQYLDQARAFLQALMHRLPGSALTLQVLTDAGAVPVAADFGDFDSLVVRWMPPDWAYSDPARPGSTDFSDGCTAKVAFSSGFTVHADTQTEPLCTISLSLGCPDDSANTVTVKFNGNPSAESAAEAVLELAIGFWNPAHAVVARRSQLRAVRVSPGDVRVGWLTYLRLPDLAAEALAPNGQWSARALGAGTLFRTEANLPPPGEPAQNSTATALRDALQRQGLLALPWNRFGGP